MFSILVWIALGLVAGLLAKWIMPGNDGEGFIMTVVLGIAGSLVGGWVGSLVGLGKMGSFSFSGIITAVVGALIILAIWHLIIKKK